MARQIFPDEGSRLVFRMMGANKPLLGAAGGTATVYLDELGNDLADIATMDDVLIESSMLTVSANSQLPLFKGPDGVDTVYVSVDGGPFSPVYSRADDRLDDVAAELTVLRLGTVRSVNGVVPDAGGNVVLASGSVTDASAVSKGVLALTGDLGGTADAPTTPTALHTSGAETANGVKTFNDKPVVPDSTFTIAKTTGLQSALDLKAALANVPTYGTSRVTGGAVHIFPQTTDPGGIALPGDIWVGELAP